jgi:hypothetical protein
MAKGKKKDYVSFWFWMLAIFVMALPCIGFIMIIVWAIIGDNESRKNYFRALIAWAVILTLAWVIIVTLGLSPLILKQFQIWMQRK